MPATYSNQSSFSKTVARAMQFQSIYTSHLFNMILVSNDCLDSVWFQNKKKQQHRRRIRRKRSLDKMLATITFCVIPSRATTNCCFFFCCFAKVNLMQKKTMKWNSSTIRTNPSKVNRKICVRTCFNVGRRFARKKRVHNINSWSVSCSLFLSFRLFVWMRCFFFVTLYHTSIMRGIIL